MGLAHIGWKLPETEKTLPKLMSEAGYRSFLIGHEHEHPDRACLGYDEVRPEKHEKMARIVTPVAVDFIQEQARRKDGPWYASVGFFEPHDPCDRPEYTPDDPSDAWVPPYVYDTPGIRKRIAAYQGSIKHMDENVGRILDALERTGQAEDTLLIFTTDHGSAFPRAKCNLYEPGIRISLLFRWPGEFPSGAVVSEMVGTIDILPTLLQVAGGNVPENIEGESFLAALKGEEFSGRELIFAEKFWHVTYDPIHSVRDERYKYIRNLAPGRAYQNGPQPDNPQLPDSLKGDRVPEELYDLQSDPIEYSNLVDQPEYEGVLSNMRNIMEQWMTGTDDPILKGHIPHPIHGMPDENGIPTDIREEFLNASQAKAFLGRTKP
jgi:arylsulfatase A-like enzyme